MKTFNELREEAKISRTFPMPKDTDAMGAFVETSQKNRFEIYPVHAKDSFAKQIGATHMIHPFSSHIAQGEKFRYAKIKKTRVEVAIDEDETGNAVWEKWNIRNLVWYKK